MAVKISRIRADEGKWFCHGCHNRAVIEVNFGAMRAPARLCARDAKYIADFLNRRLVEHEAGAPIPAPRLGPGRFKDEDTRGNR
jgi:hypothetical protein